MRLIRLRSNCPDTETCPTLYWTDHGTAVVQGYLVTDPQILGALTLATGQTAVEVPLALLAGLDVSDPSLCTTERGTVHLFRWETLPAYEVASDGSDYRRYLDGADAPTPERKQPWLDTLRAWADKGRSRRRVRVIHDPITDYERYACEWGYALNAQAGELIRVIDLADTQLPQELTRMVGDFWLIDGREAVAMHYQPDGQFRAAEVVGPHQVAEHRIAAEVAWEIGEDFPTWWKQHPQHHRSAHRAA